MEVRMVGFGELVELSENDRQQSESSAIGWKVSSYFFTSVGEASVGTPSVS